jgi:nucleoside-diphosphate-sugar epimerase
MSLSITGSTGTIGRHIPSGVRRLKLDLHSLQSNTAARFIEHQDTIIHLAGVVGPAKVNEDPGYAEAVNVIGTAVLAKEFIKKSSGKFYYISTSHVYSPTAERITETSKISPSTLYAEQKLIAERTLSEIFSSEPSRLCIIRVFSVLDWDTGPFSLGGGVQKLSRGEPGFILRNASDTRDFLTPKTIAESLFQIASSEDVSGVFNLCSGIGTKVGEASMRMLKESGYVVSPDAFEWGHSNNPVVIGDNTRLKSTYPKLDLVWRPSTLNQHGKNHQVG